MAGNGTSKRESKASPRPGRLVAFRDKSGRLRQVFVPDRGREVNNAPEGRRVELPRTASAPTRLAILHDLGAALRPHVKFIRATAPGAWVGVRGALVRDAEGPRDDPAPFDPNDFSVDAFIVSDALADRFPRGEGFRPGGALPEIAAIQKSLDTSLRQLPSFRGLRREPFRFRIMTRAELYASLKRGEPQMFLMSP